MQDKPSNEQLAWAAGLFEGEGCIHAYHAGKRGSGCQMRLGMTDRDVVERFAAIMGCGNIYQPRIDRCKRSDPRKQGKKPVHTWCLYKAPELIAALEALMPWFGERRLKRANEVIEIARDIVPLGERTHCPQGHLYSGDNLLTESITRETASGEKRSYVHRRCKTCRRKQERERKAKARERK